MATQTSARPLVLAPAQPAATSARLPWHLLTLSLVLADSLALGAAFALAYLIRFKAGLPLLEIPPHQLAFYTSVVYWSLPVWLFVMALFRLYDRHYLFSGFQEYTRVMNACTGGVVVTIVVSFLDADLSMSRGWLMIVWILSILLVGGERFLVRRGVRALRARGYFVARTLIVGANDEAHALAEQLIGFAGSGAHVVGLINTGSQSFGPDGDNLPVLGTLSDLEEVTRREDIDEIVIAMTSIRRDDLIELYRTFGHNRDVEIRLSSGLFEVLTTGATVREIACVPLVTPQRIRITGVDAAFKTILDYVGALAGLIVFSPLFLVIAIAIRLDSPGPVFHRRRVLGRSAKPFGAFKFRTMVVNADEVLARDPALRAAFNAGYKLKSDPRITRVGSFLRRTSLDELPQLINVLRGEMSLVGPRMIAPDEAVRYGKWQLNLLTVKPGITGPWQVQGRSDIPYEDRVQLSMHYIRNYSIWLDFEILLRTIPAVLQSRGAY